MLRRSLVSFLFVLFGVMERCQCGYGFYTIVASENIRPHSDYRISVTVHNQTEPTAFKLSIEDDDDDEAISSTEVALSSNETQIVTLTLEDLVVNNNYKFVAEGISGIIFKNSSLLNVESKNCSLFIQSDKGIYKPGESIQFRVLVLDFNLKPVDLHDSNLKVFITDSGKNRIKQWKNAKLNTGVFSGELQLSEAPVLGDWSLTAELDGEIKSKTVQVEEYVLPKFEVLIDSSEHFNVKDGKVRAIVRSKYTYGKLVKGQATMTIRPTNYLAWSTRRGTDSIAKTIAVNGKGTVEFDIADDLHIPIDEFKRDTSYALTAVVVEELTGRNETATKDITIHQLRYKIKAIDLKSQFQMGLPVESTIAVTYQDDTPVMVNDATKTIVISKVPNNKNLSETYLKYELTANGTTGIRLSTSAKDESGFILKVKYMDEEAEIGYLFPTSNIDPSNLEIKILTKTPTLNKDIFVEVQSLDSLEHLTYQVIGQGKLIYSESLAVPQRNYHVFNFKATFDLLPRAHLIVYYFKGDDIVSAKIDIFIRGHLNNFVKLKLSENQVKPGDNIRIDITSNPKSLVGILGVDQSALLLKKNNDLTVEDAWNERELYQYQLHERIHTNTNGHSPYFHNKYWNDFQSSRVILFTNARQDVKPIIREYDRPVFFNKGGDIIGVLQDSLSFESYAAQPGKVHHLSAPLSAAPLPSPKIRKDFPETWLWQSIILDSSNGTYTLEKLVPDTITSWMLSAFSIDPVNGLGFTKSPRKLQVFQPFFVSLNLPYSIKRGEILSVPVIVFNYMENETNAQITIHNADNEFDLIDSNNTIENVDERTEMLSIASNNAASTVFTIKPKKIGAISIKVKVTSPFAGDSIVQILHVEPEGIKKFKNKALFVDLNDVSTFESNLNVDVPDDIIPDSLKIEVNCVGDLFGGTIKNLNRLIRLPSGCGEQNMLNFVPNIVIWKYLSAVDQLKPEIERKIKSYTEKGYQRQLTYRHPDGSFSAFGKSDKTGSTWLTAFVAKSFQQAASFIDVDEKIVNEALKWLSKQQNNDGSFSEVGTVSHKAMQGGSRKGIALTAYVLTTFLENEKLPSIYNETIKESIDHLIKSFDEQDDVYPLAVTAYALQLADHEQKETILDSLVKYASERDESKWWNRYASKKNATTRSSRTLDIEITSYGLLALLESGRFSDGFPYFKWLLLQRNNKGGFIGTQDTILGLQALAKFAERISIEENNIELMVNIVDAIDSIDAINFNVNPENVLIYQSHELPSSVRAINVTANGHGFAQFQLSYSYSTNKTEQNPSFVLKSRILDDTNAARLKFDACVTYAPIQSKENRTNMVILEVSLPSGYLAESDALQNVSNAQNVKKVETKNANTVFVVYFDNLVVNRTVCPVFEAYRMHSVDEQKPIPITVYDYYENDDRATTFYTLPSFKNEHVLAQLI